MTAMPEVAGLFEAHLTVSDLDRSTAFYRDVVGLPIALELPERGAVFFWVGAPGEAMLGLWSLGSAPMGLSLHVALKASLGDVLGACDALRSHGVTPLSFFGGETTEPTVIGWMPAATLYFHDPDGHLIEYLTMLEEPARADRGIVPWSDWKTVQPSADTIDVDRYAGPRGELRALFEEAEDSAAELNAYAAVELTRSRGHSTLAVATAAADVGNLRFYQLAGFRLRTVERDAFTPIAGYPAELVVDGIQLRDRVRLDLHVDPVR